MGADLVACDDSKCPGVHDETINIHLFQALTSYNFIQHVTATNYDKGNTLNLVITSPVEHLISVTVVRDIGISDHYLISVPLTCIVNNFKWILLWCSTN